MMKIVVQMLAGVGGLVVTFGIICGLLKLRDLFERVERLERNDDVRRDDIIDIRGKLQRIKEDEE